MRDITFNSIGILMVVSIIADLITIGGLFFAIISRNYEKISFKILLVAGLFVAAILLFQVSVSGEDIDFLFDVEAAVYWAGVAYFLLSAVSLAAVCYITFNTEYKGIDYLFFVIAILVPYILGIVLHAMMFGEQEFLVLSPVFLYLAIFQGILMSKNYVLNKIRRKELRSSTSGLGVFAGRTKAMQASASYFVRELLLVVVAYSLGVFLFALNNPHYQGNVKEFLGAVSRVFQW